jgi:hypothetical protein
VTPLSILKRVLDNGRRISFRTIHVWGIRDGRIRRDVWLDGVCILAELTASEPASRTTWRLRFRSRTTRENIPVARHALTVRPTHPTRNMGLTCVPVSQKHGELHADTAGGRRGGGHGYSNNR